MPIICGKLLSNAVRLYNATLYLKTSQKWRVIHAFNCEVLQGACTKLQQVVQVFYSAYMGMVWEMQSNLTTCNLHVYSTTSAASIDLKNRKSQQCFLNFKHLKIFVLGSCPESPLIYTSICKLLPAELDVSSTHISSGPVVLYKPHVWNLISFELPKEKGILKKKVL